MCSSDLTIAGAIEPAAAPKAKMRSFAGSVSFEPKGADLSLTIAANDFQRDLLLPRFFGHVAAQVKSLNLRVIPSQSPSPAMLRENRCDLLISPLPPSGIDIMQKPLEGSLCLLLRQQGSSLASNTPRLSRGAPRHCGLY